jgi:YggT family protein
MLDLSVPLNPIAYLVLNILDVYKWIVIAAVIVSWLAAFNVINERNNFVRSLLRVLYNLTEPVFRPIRRLLPAMGGLDLSPLIVLLIIATIQYAMTNWPPLRNLGW